MVQVTVPVTASGETAAVNVTDWPVTGDDGDAVTAVPDDALRTARLVDPDDAVKLGSPP
jgi:hypothetical protein